MAYDGTDFVGFQWQAQGRTVQGVLEAALRGVTQTDCRVVGSGRTDSGVHASGQVIAFHVAWRHSLADLQRALNATLPQDIVVRAVEPAEPDWHPRFSALRRHYRYTVLNQALRSPLQRRHAHLVAQPLSLQALQAGADLLVGEHDFASFGQPMGRASTGRNPAPAGCGTGRGSTIRVIYSARWQELASPRMGGDDLAGDGSWFIFDVVGNAFLRGMVRSIVGALLQVGSGAWPAQRVAEVLAARDRALAAPPAPACGLCLVRVEYRDQESGIRGQRSLTTDS